MKRRISLQLPWNPDHLDTFLAWVRAADEAGVHSIWLNEGFGHDVFSGLALAAQQSRRVLLGASIVNIYSRTPGALAQHFATIDQLSGGRVLVGLGTSAPGVIERFHGLAYERPLTRLRETVELLGLFWQRKRFSYQGRVFHLDRTLEMGVTPVQPSPPVFLATMAPAGVRLTAEVADGWLPAWIPDSRVAGEIAELRQLAAGQGRDPAALLVRGPNTTVVVNDPARAERQRRQRAETLAFFVARNGEFYYRQFERQGLAEAAKAIRAAWTQGGAAAAVAATPPDMAGQFSFIGELSACIAHLDAQQSAGVDIHPVAVDSDDPAEVTAALTALVEG